MGKDGILEVALSVAAVSAFVRVDLAQMPVATDPPDLFNRSFNDEMVGFSDEHMAFFKARLKGFLPEIGATIDEIPNDASLVVGDVHRAVWLALQAIGADADQRQLRSVGTHGPGGGPPE